MQKIKKIEIKYRVGGKIDYKKDTYTVKLKRIFLYISLVVSAMFAPLIYIWLNSIKKINSVLLLPFYLTILYFVLAFILVYLIFYVILQLFQKNDVVCGSTYYIYNCKEKGTVKYLNCNYSYKDYIYNVFVTKEKSKKVYAICVSEKEMPRLPVLLPELETKFNIHESRFDQIHIDIIFCIYMPEEINEKQIEKLLNVKESNTIYAIYEKKENKLYIQKYTGKELDILYAKEYENILDYVYEKCLKEDK